MSSMRRTVTLPWRRRQPRRCRRHRCHHGEHGQHGGETAASRRCGPPRSCESPAGIASAIVFRRLTQGATLRTCVGRATRQHWSHRLKGKHTMSTITTKDGTQIFYNDWGTGQPGVFSHGWPLSADAFEDQMSFLASRGYRCIAHDRRGHGRSSQPFNGNDMDTYADDLAELVQALDLQKAIHVGHSTGGGEVTRYIARHGTKRVAKAVLIGAVPPLMLKTAANPGG